MLRTAQLLPQKIVIAPAAPLPGMRMAARMWLADVGSAWLCETVQKIDAGALTFGCPPVASRTRVSVSQLTSGAPRAACVPFLPFEEAGRLAGMQVLYERCAAVDVGKDVIAVAVRLPGDGPGGRATVKRTFKTFYGVLGEAARWLTSLGVTHVAMEATGIYSMPVYHALIEHGEFTQVLVCNAGHVKNVPGRKTDLLTELPAGLGQVSGRVGVWVVSVCRHDHWRRSTAGVVPSGSAAVRFAGGDRGSVSAVPADRRRWRGDSRGCGLLPGAGCVRAGSCDSAVVWDGVAALVAVPCGCEDRLGSGDPGGGPGLPVLGSARSLTGKCAQLSSGHRRSGSA